MSLKITNAEAAYSNDFPVYGHIVEQNSLRLALRATGYSNLIDLSPLENSFAVGSEVIFTPTGPRTLPNGSGIRSNYQEQDDSVTVLCAVKIDKSTRAAFPGDSQYRAYAFGSFAGTATAGGGIGVAAYSVANAVTPGTYDLELRFLSRMKNRTTGLYGTVVLKFALFSAMAVLPASTGWLFIAASLNHVTGEAVLKAINKGLEARYTYDVATWFTDVASRGTTFDATGLPLYHHIGATAVPYAGTERNEVYVPDYLLHSGVLSDATVAAQYEASKKWLLAARGIVI